MRPNRLQSLTSGMYSDPFVIFREYIQNAADSIDSAVDSGILYAGEGRVNIEILSAERAIHIYDNGLGISNDLAEKSLISIGNSKKTSNNSRGFRGIGRLSGLSYCSKLVFETSFSGENIGTRVSIDAKALAELLTSNDSDDITAVDVLRTVYTVEHFSAKSSDHYFSVMMNGVDTSSGLTNYDDVYEYISQNAPVPYSPEFFTWGHEIEKRLLSEGYCIPNINITLIYGDKKQPIYKPYKDEFLVDKGKNITDCIKDIDIIKIGQTKDLKAIGWIAKTNYLGSIYDKSIKGIRVRKGNILIGDSQTLNVTFKDARFNGWSIGEIFAIDSKLIPNARRDNFEKNQAYFLLAEHMTTLASSISKDIRNASLKRNSELSGALTKTKEASNEVTEALNAGITGTQKVVLKQRVSAAKSAVSDIQPTTPIDEYFQNIAFEELDMLIGKLQGATSYKSLNVIKSLSKTEKQVLEKVFNVILLQEITDANKLIDAILDAFLPQENKHIL